MAGGMGMASPYGAYGGMMAPQPSYGYHYHPVVSPTATSTTPSRITNGKRGGIYDNYFQMQMLNNMFHPTNQQGAAAGNLQGASTATATGNQNAMNMNNWAAMEMALGDASTPPVQPPAVDVTFNDAGTGASATPANQVVVENATPQ